MNRLPHITAVLASVLILTVASCSPSGTAGKDDSTTGVTATTVTIGSHQSLTGPVAIGFQDLAPAAKAYFDHVNANGGVHGRKIFFNYLDDAYNPANAPKVVRRLVEKDKVFAIFGGFGTAPHQAVAGYLNDRKVPDLFPISGCTCWNDPNRLPYTFAYQTDFLREGKILGDHVNKTFPGKKVAYIYQNDDFGKTGVKGLDKVIPSSSVVARVSYVSGYNDVTPQMQAIDRAQADVIVSFSTPPVTALLRLAQKKLGNTAQLVVNYSGSDPNILSGLLESAAPRDDASSSGHPLLQGIITDAYLPPVADTSNEWISLVRMIHDRYLPTRPLDRYTVLGVATAYLFVEALQRAGKDLTRQSLVATLEKGGFSPGPGVTPLGYSRTSHAGYTGTQIGVIKHDAIVLQGTPMVTDTGSGPVVPYTTPSTNPPANGIPPP